MRARLIELTEVIRNHIAIRLLLGHWYWLWMSIITIFIRWYNGRKLCEYLLTGAATVRICNILITTIYGVIKIPSRIIRLIIASWIECLLLNFLLPIKLSWIYCLMSAIRSSTVRSNWVMAIRSALTFCLNLCLLVSQVLRRIAVLESWQFGFDGRQSLFKVSNLTIKIVRCLRVGFLKCSSVLAPRQNWELIIGYFHSSILMRIARIGLHSSWML